MKAFFLVTFDDDGACENGSREFPVSEKGTQDMTEFLDRAVNRFENIMVRKVEVVQEYTLGVRLIGK